ncbi:hypothetical protein WJX73_005822 [Symbiochloris irregularis]|uniref:Formamidopyrimidine-DNA glycosylase catalytic domain-containing protein n=1 Tax=Symbiochloris irregularis TaxID=706552 RepID=A0AAW1NQW7_9CHLO
MPELPEVEAARVLVAGHCLNRKIESATVAKDEKVIEGISNTDLEALLNGKQITAACRKGKHLWLEFDSGPSVMFHFGMTGSMVVKGVAAARYRSFVVDEEQWPPKFWKVQINLAGNVQLAFADGRRFARVRVQEDPAANPPISSLGFDPLLSMPPLKDFRGLISKQQRQIKVVLMDQSFSAGVGNWVADEVLFQARIHPEDRANGLSEEQVEKLHHWLHEVPRQACEVGAVSDNFPSSWLFTHRWSQKGNPCVEGGHKIEFNTVGGRTTAVVPALQQRTTSDPVKRGASGGSKRKRKDKGAEQDNDDSAPAAEATAEDLDSNRGPGFCR